MVSPGSELPEAVRQYAPPAVQRRTSYHALKAAGHMAAGHIEMWRRCAAGQFVCASVSVRAGNQRAYLPLGPNQLVSQWAQAAAGAAAARPPAARHGSVHKTTDRSSATAPDPYEAIREALGKARRQELFSFAAAQLLVMGTPERAALLLRCAIWLAGGLDWWAGLVGWAGGRAWLPALALVTPSGPAPPCCSGREMSTLTARPFAASACLQPGLWCSAQFRSDCAAAILLGTASQG